MRETPLKIISGGQTGARRAALDWAIERGLEHGGWCPRGRRAEDGAVPLHYHLIETPTERWEQRTEWNVRDSDGTVIFTVSETLTGGSLTTVELAPGFREALPASLAARRWRPGRPQAARLRG